MLLLPAWAAAEVAVLALFKDRAVLRIDGEQRMLVVGQRSPEGVKLIAADSGSALLEIDGERRRLELGSHIDSAYAPPATREVHLWPDSRGMYRLDDAVNGKAVRFLVDTGASTIALNSEEAERLGIDYKRRGMPTRVETAAGAVPGYWLRINRVRAGEITLHNVEAVVVEGRDPATALLGMSFLNRLEMERSGSAMVLRKRF